MPRTKRPKPIYQRGEFRLYRREDRKNLEIIFYDEQRRRERSVSAGTEDDGEAVKEVDRLYLAKHGAGVCPTCGRAWEGDHAPELAGVISDYLLQHEGKASYKGSTLNRLGHVVDYITETDPKVTVPMVNEAWVEGFRKWMLARPVISPKGKVLRPRSIGHVEGCVLQLAAAINATKTHRAQFRASSLKEASNTPVYRASIDTLADMFRFALDHEDRHTLRAYLRAAIATWARPEALLDLTDRQWHAEAGVLDLNPPGRRQTKKHRPAVPIARQYRPFLDALNGQLLPVVTLRHAWDPMRKKLDLPGGGQAGTKLIRRSVATLARRKIGEAHWAQGEMMLGHRRASTSDIYALPDPANLGRALSATEEIIAEIEAKVPQSYRIFTADIASLKIVQGGKNG